MKIRLTFVIFAFTLLFAVDGYSQMNRSVGRNQYKRSIVKTENKKSDFTEDALDYLKKELKLDGFQEAAVREIIKEYKDAAQALIDAKDMTMQEKRDKSFALSYKIYQQAAPLLSKEQVEKYKEILKLEKEEIPVED